MYLKKDGSIYTLPLYSALSGLSVERRISDTPKVSQHGGTPTGDGKINSRTIDISVFIDGQNQADYLAQVDELKRNLSLTDAELFITDNRYINISGLNKLKEEFISGFYLVKANITATLKALDPFLYDTDPVVISEPIAATPQQFTVNNPGNIDTPLIIAITANSLNSAITLKNITDKNRILTYTDAGFTAGKTLVISALGGTVKLNGSNTINAFTGTFMSLLPGDNIFEYTGGNCTIAMSYSVRWL